MTGQQAIYFDAIKKYIAKNRHSPTYKEIADMVGVRSLASVHKMVHKLIQQGYLTREAGHYENLVVVPEKFDGFNRCARYHVEIYFLGSVCPLCEEILKHARAVSSV